MNPDSLPLRDIHLPAPLGWWPLAPGWWIVSIGFILLIAVLIWFWRKRRTSNIPVYSALDELKRIELEYVGDQLLLAQELSVLLRRTAMSLYGRDATAGLTGTAWLAFLDAHLGKKVFNTETGQFLLQSVYNPNAKVDTLALVNSIRMWITTPTKHEGKRHV